MEDTRLDVLSQQHANSSQAMNSFPATTDEVKTTVDSLAHSVKESAASKVRIVQDKAHRNERAWSMLVFYWVCPNT